MSALKNLLEGRPFRSPLHPAVVHLPLALFPLAVLCDVGSRIWPAPEYFLVPAAYYSLVGGLLTAAVAAALGLVDYTDLRRDSPARKTATRHLVLNVVALALFAGSAVLHHRDLDTVRIAYPPLLLSVVGLGVLAYSGYLGGHLVYSEGSAVGRHRRETPLPDETITVASTTRNMVAAADASALQERATLRVNAGGTIVTIARLDGRVYAFQEFCTHRCGPLSEGAFDGCDVICPWHNSRFDVRTGKVKDGPAKLALPVYKVEERNGKLWLESPPHPKT